MNGCSERPTRFARAVAFVIDGGYALTLLVQATALTAWLRAALLEGHLGELAIDHREILAQYGASLFGWAIFVLAMEAISHGPWWGPAGSPGLALAGLKLEDPAAPRRALRRATRVLLAASALAIAGTLLRIEVTSAPAMLRVTLALAVVGAAALAGLVLTAFESIAVIGDPSRRVLGDLLAGTRVILETDASLRVRRACRVAFVLGVAALLGVAIGMLEDYRLSQTSSLITSSPIAGLPELVVRLYYVAMGAAFATLFCSTRIGGNSRARTPLAVALLATMPLVSVLFVRARIRALAQALELSHGEAMSLAALADVMTVAQSASLLSGLALAEDPYFAEESVRLVLAVSGPVSFLATAALFRRLAALDLRPVLTPAPKPELADVFA